MTPYSLYKSVCVATVCFFRAPKWKPSREHTCVYDFISKAKKHIHTKIVCLFTTMLIFWMFTLSVCIILFQTHTTRYVFHTLCRLCVFICIFLLCSLNNNHMFLLVIVSFHSFKCSKVTRAGFHLGAPQNVKLWQSHFYRKYIGKPSSRKLRRAIYYTVYRMYPHKTY